jgi:predicted ATPase
MQFENHRPLRFTGIRVENWRNFGQAEVDLQRRVFIVGPNASGKSNFLDLFRFLHVWATLDGTSTLLLEEPELSLHPEVIRYLPQMFARIQRRSGRQIIASTHSTDLLREGVGSNEVVLLSPSQEGTTARIAGTLWKSKSFWRVA